jgi:hypothetical protein
MLGRASSLPLSSCHDPLGLSARWPLAVMLFRHIPRCHAVIQISAGLTRLTLAEFDFATQLRHNTSGALPAA